MAFFQLTLLSFFVLCHCNKYSEKMNSPEYNKLLQTDKPFRIQKINLIWSKALKKLAPEKLKLLYTDLKYQDKEELNWKSDKAHGRDKTGMKENLIQASFKAIVEKYDLSEEYQVLQDAYQKKSSSQEMPNDAYIKSVFRDKKLNKLWMKAEQQGFNDQELNALKEEFIHHQNKIDQYYSIMNQLNKKTAGDEMENSVDSVLYAEVGEKIYKSENPHQALKEKHSQLKVGYEYLSNRVKAEGKKLEFEEPQVNTLWEMAKNTTFTPQELDSLKSELHHFEHRLQKLKTLTALEMHEDIANDIDEVVAKKAKKLKEFDYKVKKIHQDLTSRILQKHSEL